MKTPKEAVGPGSLCIILTHSNKLLRSDEAMKGGGVWVPSGSSVWESKGTREINGRQGQFSEVCYADLSWRLPAQSALVIDRALFGGETQFCKCKCVTFAPHNAALFFRKKAGRAKSSSLSAVTWPPSTPNNPHAKVVYFSVAYFDPLYLQCRKLNSINSVTIFW